MDKGARQNSFIGIVSRVRQLGQNFEGKESRPCLNDACGFGQRQIDCEKSLVDSTVTARTRQ